MQPPPIDTRSYQQLVAQLAALTEEFTSELANPWRHHGRLGVHSTVEHLIGKVLDERILESQADKEIARRGAVVDQKLATIIAALRKDNATLTQVVHLPAHSADLDLGLTLMHLFAGMLAQAIDRLNRTPEKNFLAYLDLIGVQQQPPQAARVPLTFTLANGSTSFAVVPAGTQVAAPPPEGDAEERVFETERILVLTPSRLSAVFTHDPLTDQFADNTTTALGERDASFAAFAGSEPIEHSLYLAWDGLLTLPAPKTIQISFTSPSADRMLNLKLLWERWDGAQWKKLEARAELKGGHYLVSIEAEPPVPRQIAGVVAGWVRVRLDQPLIVNGAQQASGADEIPSIAAISAAFTVPAASGPPPSHAFFNSTPLDLSKDFYPFGEHPALTDTFYLAGHTPFARPGTRVELDIVLGKSGVANNIHVDWETWVGDGWQIVDATDGTAGFTTSGTISFPLPERAAAGVVNGVEGFWLRARIARGDYGAALSYQPLLDGEKKPVTQKYGGDDVVVYRRTSPGFSPPLVRSLRLGYETGKLPPSAVMSLNTLDYHDQTRELASGAGFKPFTALDELRPALYLGFDQPFAPRRVSLYAQVVPNPLDPSTAGTAASAHLVWEYLGPGGWRYLGVEDETAALGERGLVTFLGPHDLQARRRFGQQLHWLRVRWEDGHYPAMPQLRRLLLNTTWASQSITLTNEILGSSDGSPDQSFFTARAPVLHGQRVEVLEPVELFPGGAAVAPTAVVAGGSRVSWTTWHQVPDFYSSGPGDRHYVLDHLSGELSFGDGRRGMVPPISRDGVRISYRTGGGVRGNTPAGALTQLKTSIPTVAGVTNYEPAAGGADAETTAELKERGPSTLRHRGRAVAAQDLEDLAHEASPELARARAVSPRFDPLSLGARWLDPGKKLPPEEVAQRLEDVEGAGAVELILVPHSEADRPALSQELARRVLVYLRERCAPTLQIKVREPEWAPVHVTAKVVPTSLEAAETLKEAVEAALRRFLHPLSGGDEGTGWPFARSAYRSDLYGLIEGLAGVEYVKELELGGPPEGELSPQALVCSGEHAVTIELPERPA